MSFEVKLDNIRNAWQQPAPLNYDDGTDTRYELVDGVLVEMGAESTINTRIAIFLLLYFA